MELKILILKNEELFKKELKKVYLIDILGTVVNIDLVILKKIRIFVHYYGMGFDSNK